MVSSKVSVWAAGVMGVVKVGDTAVVDDRVTVVPAVCSHR